MLDCSRCGVTVVIHGVTFFGGGLAGEIAFPSKRLAMGVGAFARAIIRWKGLRIIPDSPPRATLLAQGWPTPN